MNWSEIITNLRKEKGWSVRKLGEEVGMNISNLSRIERGEISPSVDNLQKICKALGAEVEIKKKDGN
jgi:transcriptional regulator with XRE-family HTH domain